MWHGHYIIKRVLKNGAYELIDYEVHPLDQPINGLYLKKYFAWVIQACFVYIGVFFIFLHVLIWCALRAFSCLFESYLFVYMSITPYVGFADGASRSTRNLSSAAWVIYDPAGELIEL